MSLSNKEIKALQVDKVYKIAHIRKGKFIGQFLGYDDEPERLGDKEDKVFLTFKYDVRVGTDQAHMSTGVKLETGEKAPVRVSNLRPSLITEIQLSLDGEWLRNMKVAEIPVSKKKEAGWLDKLLGRS